jgi:multidrug efflux pump subunit AcrB
MRTLVLLAALAGCRDKAPAPSPPAIAIELTYAGANAALIERMAVMPIEQRVNGITGVTQIESRIDTDRATILVELDRNVDTAMHEVHHAIASAELPAEVPPPTLHTTRRDDTPVVWLALRGELVTELSAFVHEEVFMRLQRIPGVSQVEAQGLAEPTLVVWPELERMTATGVSMFDVVAALQATDAGSFETFADLIVKPQVRLRDIARIESTSERTPGDPMIAVHARFDANRDAVLRAVRDELAKLQPPTGISITETKRDPPARPALVATLQGEELAQLRELADDCVKRLAAAGVRDVVVDPPAGQPEQTVLPDRTRMAELGVSPADIHATLRVIGAQRISWTQLDGRRRPVVIKLPSNKLDDVADKLTVRGVNGLVPLSSLITVRFDLAESILRIGMRRTIRLSIRGDADAAKRVLREQPLPPGVTLK